MMEPVIEPIQRGVRAEEMADAGISTSVPSARAGQVSLLLVTGLHPRPVGGEGGGSAR